MTMITDIEDFFAKGCGRCDRFDTPDCSTRIWAGGLARLREICLAAGLVETVKWGHPCYMHGDRNVAIIGAFREDFRITFFDASLLEDAERVLEKQGPNTRHADALRFSSVGGVDDMESTIRAYLQELTRYIDAGIRPEKTEVEVELPEELLEAMHGDPELAEAFRALTPGRQRSYVINLASAKKSATRIARISKFRDKILAGKGATER